jgi:hypothetical protein
MRIALFAENTLWECRICTDLARLPCIENLILTEAAKLHFELCIARAN